jgi:type IV pilus assembly protein PilY1
MNIIKNIRIGFSALAITIIAATPALAEDIEIYTQTNLGAAAVKPNIMFILDTSGSMDSRMDIDEAYDPAVDYSNRAGACFDNARMYPSTTVNVSCTPVFRNNYFPMSQNQCQAMRNAFDVVGFYTGTFAHWNANKSYWGGLTSNYNSDSNYIECDTDQGVHGNGGAETYINVAGGGNAYTSSAADQAISWSSIETDTETFYSGNYMNYRVTSVAVQSTRFNVMRDVIKNLVFGIDGVNVGLMRFDGRSDADGGSVVYQVQDVTASRDNMKNQMDSWTADGFTPLSETLYEAYLYFSGGEIYYGNQATPQSVGESKINGDPSHYASPVDPDYAGCQRQFIIYLSDGQPTRDTGAENRIEALPGFISTDGRSDCSGWGDGSCLDDLAGYMNKHGFDVYTENGTIEDVRVNTYTIGFDSDIPILNDTAQQGGGEYFVAYGATELLNTLNAILREIKAIHTTFSSPAVSINAFNRSTHRDDLYFTLFKPDTKPHWHGNFKRFKLDFDISGNPEIVDVTGASAVSAVTGFFRDSSQSWWTPAEDAPDGRLTEKGGAASKLFTGNTFSTGRQVYSNVSATSNLSSSGNWVEPGNANIDLTMLGAPGQTTAYRDDLLNWARGVDVRDDDVDGDTTDARRIMGDPLHAQPALVQYGGTDADPDITAYVATNDGYLHAFNTQSASGNELFAFIPDDLLANINTLFTNTNSQKTYGLDGNVTAWVKDVDLDGNIEQGDGDHVYLYFGMRRGGRNYYALDVTDRANPRFMWKIQGGVSGALGDFTELGQTWSTPRHAVIRLAGSDRNVLIFAGGYDVAQDSLTTRSTDSVGRAVYIIDATTGNLLWRASSAGGADLALTDMDYSIPSDVAAVDSDGDSYTDKIYVGDMGGQVWRFDINNKLGETSGSIAGIITGGRIADLADDTADANRRFYYPPDVALLKDRSGLLYISLMIASGNRSHPVNRTVQDRIFMLRDRPIGTATSYTTITENNNTHDLFDTTSNIIGQGSQGQVDTARTSLSAASGWYIDLDQSIGEKSLTKPLIFAGEAFITTYVPNDPAQTSAASCEPQEGSGFLYHINLADGTPVKNYDQIVSSDPDALTYEDRKVALARSGIPADPTIIMPEAGTAICVSTECEKMDLSGEQDTLYWFEEE